jgi:hypothetical protein
MIRNYYKKKETQNEQKLKQTIIENMGVSGKTRTRGYRVTW